MSPLRVGLPILHVVFSGWSGVSRGPFSSVWNSFLLVYPFYIVFGNNAGSPLPSNSVTLLVSKSPLVDPFVMDMSSSFANLFTNVCGVTTTFLSSVP